MSAFDPEPEGVINVIKRTSRGRCWKCRLLILLRIPPLNLQRHATVKAKSLFQQQSRTKQLSVAMWPAHELKPNW